MEPKSENVINQTIVLNDKEKKNLTKKSLNNISLESIIKQNSDIVFNNQTNKLLKKVDKNCSIQKTEAVMGKYNLRKKSIQNRLDTTKKQQAEKHLRGLEDSKPKKRSSQLSKYKRKNANARERSRVQEINAAFEKLKKILPCDSSSQKTDDSKLTKIATLRHAANHIANLSKILNQTINLTEEKNILNATYIPNKLVDTLPDISFISSDELSSLSFIDDEENQMSVQSCNEQDIPCLNGTYTLSSQSIDSIDVTCEDQLMEINSSKPNNISLNEQVFIPMDENNNLQVGQNFNNTRIITPSSSYKNEYLHKQNNYTSTPIVNNTLNPNMYFDSLIPPIKCSTPDFLNNYVSIKNFSTNDENLLSSINQENLDDDNYLYTTFTTNDFDLIL